MMVPLKGSRPTMAAQSRGAEGLRPAAERLVGGDSDAVLLLALGQDLEQQLGAVPVQFRISQLVDAQKAEAAVNSSAWKPR